MRVALWEEAQVRVSLGSPVFPSVSTRANNEIGLISVKRHVTATESARTQIFKDRVATSSVEGPSRLAVTLAGIPATSHPVSTHAITRRSITCTNTLSRLQRAEALRRQGRPHLRVQPPQEARQMPRHRDKPHAGPTPPPLRRRMRPSKARRPTPRRLRHRARPHGRACPLLRHDPRPLPGEPILGRGAGV